MNNKKSYLAIFGIILAVGLMASAFILGNQFKNLRQTGSISVKGLAESHHTLNTRHMGYPHKMVGEQLIMMPWQLIRKLK